MDPFDRFKNDPFKKFEKPLFGVPERDPMSQRYIPTPTGHISGMPPEVWTIVNNPPSYDQRDIDSFYQTGFMPEPLAEKYMLYEKNGGPGIYASPKLKEQHDAIKLKLEFLRLFGL